MRAVVLRGGHLEVRETADPVPGPGQMLVKTISTAICASDVHYMDHPEIVAADASGRMVYDENRDVVMGHEFVAEVIAHGPDCSGKFPLGSRVTSIPALLADGDVHIIGQHPDAPGSFGELLLVSEAFARTVPDTVNPDAVALVDAFAVGEFYVRSSAIAPGQIPIVIGAGAIGLSTVAALAKRQIEPILVSDYNSGRLALAKQFGAHVAVDPRQHSPHDVWREELTQRGFFSSPVIYECVGAPGLIQKIVESCAPGARIFAAGAWYTGDTVECTTATQKGLTIQFGGGPHPEDWYATLEAVCEGRLDPLPSVGRVIGLEQVPEAIDLVRQGAGPPRIVVHVGSTLIPTAQTEHD